MNSTRLNIRNTLKQSNTYPGGMEMKGRNYKIIDYRFGFQKQEKSAEISDFTNYYEFKYREYDPRLVRFSSPDPLHCHYPWNTDYAFSENRLIDAIDLEGLEKVIYTITRITEGATQIKTVTFKTLDKPGPLGSGAAVILNKDGAKYYMYGEKSKDLKDFVSHYEGREKKVYPSLEGGAPTGGIGHKLNSLIEQKKFPIGTELSNETIDGWFSDDWKIKTSVLESNQSTKDLLGGQKEAMTDFVFNGLKASSFKKGDNEKFFLGFLKGESGTIKKRIGQLILFRDNQKYNFNFLKDKKNQQNLDSQATTK